MSRTERKVARVFEEPTGLYHVCGDSLTWLDARGPGCRSKADALRLAMDCGYTHAVGSGTYWEGVRAIPIRYHSPRAGLGES